VTVATAVPEPIPGLPPLNPEEEARALFRLHGAAIYRFALVVLRHREDAEDLLQDAFVKLLLHLRSGGDRANLRGWLFTVVANGCRDRLRVRRRWIPWTRDHDRPAEPPDPVLGAERLAALRASMRHLAPRDRLLVMLRAEGLSYREIAGAAGLRAGSVGQMLARAIERWSRAYLAAAGEREPHGERRS
jgi:RNA polymerase sigma-70 factor (ECF subfamily)